MINWIYDKSCAPLIIGFLHRQQSFKEDLLALYYLATSGKARKDFRQARLQSISLVGLEGAEVSSVISRRVQFGFALPGILLALLLAFPISTGVLAHYLRPEPVAPPTGTEMPVWFYEDGGRDPKNLKPQSGKKPKIPPEFWNEISESAAPSAKQTNSADVHQVGCNCLTKSLAATAPAQSPRTKP